MSAISLTNYTNLAFDYTALAAGPSSYTGTDPSRNASYPYFQYLSGYGFSYDSLGRLYAGTVTSVTESYLSYSSSSPSTISGGSESVSGISLPVTQILNAVATGLTLQPAYVGANNLININTGSFSSISGNDTYNIVGTGANHAVDRQSLIIDGTFYGADTAVFALPGTTNLRADATLTGGGGDETVTLLTHAISETSTLTASLVLVDTLQFTDGSVYEDNQSPAAQAALIFEGIFGRLPDAVNAGGFGLVANQSGQAAAAAQMLATTEGSNDTAGLTNAQFVARLYQNMLHRTPGAQEAAGWQQDIDSGQLSRADVAARFASGVEAQSVNFAAFATGSVFGANPNAVEVLRAYELLLNREPEAGSLAGNTGALDSGGETLQSLYTSIQSSQEFASNGPNQYGITSSTPYAAVYAAAHSDPLNGMITSLVTSAGVAHLT